MTRASTLFAPLPSSASATETNREGYPAFSRSIEEKFVQTLLTNTLGQSYYTSAKDLLVEAEAIHTEMIARDPAFAAKAIVYARNAGFMRTQPIFALSLLAKTDHFAQTFGETVRTPADLADFTAMVHARRKGEGGRRIKTVAGKWLVAKLSSYWAIKYGADKSNGYSIKDLLQVYHPKFGAPSALVDYLMARKDKVADLSALPQIAAFERLKKATTEEDKVAAIIEGRLPHEVATPFAGSSKAVWKAIALQMPIFALLRNLATLERHGVMDELREHVVSTLTNVDAVKRSKIFPFRFVEAEKHVQDPRVKDALRDAVEISFDNVPDVPGRVAVMLDVSGSMNDQVGGGYSGPTRCDVGSLFAMALLKKAKGNGRLLCFNMSVVEKSFSMRDSLLTQARSITPSGGTATALPMLQILSEKDKVDSIVLITDEQQNQGTPFVNVLSRYRHDVNSKVKAFILNVGPYTDGGLVSASDPLNWFLYGWSDQALSFIGMAAKGWGGIVEEIRRGNVEATER